MAKSRTGLVSTGIALVSFLFITISFSSSYWLETDGQLKEPKFRRLGLWEVCFVNFQEPHFWYDTKFSSCWWIFEEEFYIIFDFLLPGWFVTVQFLFTLCFALHLISLGCVGLYMMCSRENYSFIKLLVFLGGALNVAAFSGTIAVYLFGLYGDGRDWMPNWEHNNMGWAYALAVIGVIGSYISGVLYLIEAKRHVKKRDKAENSLGRHSSI